MTEHVIARGPGEGRTLPVGGGDLVTYKARSAETGGAYFCFEVSTTPGLGPPLHTHAYPALEEFFEEYGRPVDANGADEAPDPRAMVDALERNGVHVVGAPA